MSQICYSLESTSKEVQEIIENSINTFKGIDGNFYYCVEENNTKHFYRGEEKHYIILSCRLKIHKGNIDEIKFLINDRTKRRIETQPLNYPSCGSVFRNPDSISAGKLIEDLGLKGYSIGGACVSTLHANFIINKDNASGEDIIKLINIIKEKAKEETGIDLVLEQEIIK